VSKVLAINLLLNKAAVIPEKCHAIRRCAASERSISIQIDGAHYLPQLNARFNHFTGENVLTSRYKK